MVNIAGGSQSMPQIGMVNVNQRDFSNAQIGFTNTIGSDLSGVQIGMVNTVVHSANGLQLGFVNTTGQEMSGVQLGFVNTTLSRCDGTQIGFINVANRVNGLQLGFVNYATNLQKGIPIGLVSYVKNGGYRAFEAGLGDVVTASMSYKIGVERFYTSLQIGYGADEELLSGLGIGSIFRINHDFFFNPELVSMQNMKGTQQMYSSLSPSIGYHLTTRLSIMASPSLIWAYSDSHTSKAKSSLSIASYDINDKNTLTISGRLGIRYRW
jgi:hypothetical protein